jgi:2-succinyl-5-enolpyruvyl-6-hydroxy-3-cyclohexene-1-carboxylate synthase
MKPRWKGRNYSIAGALVDELVRCGVRHACLCPGSRSTPVALCLARHEGIRAWVHLDERSAAYFALGLARAGLQPVAILCTSGTAAANFFPAVVEAWHARVPLVVLTADRPADVWGWGANQTIDQTRMYGSHAKWFVNLSPPQDDPGLSRYVRATTCRAAAEAVQAPAGPVHINIPFAEPLAPEEAPESAHRNAAAEEDVAAQRAAERPYLRAAGGRRRLDAMEIRSLAESLRGARRGLIVCGPQSDAAFPAAVGRLAGALGYPVLADPLSQVRCGAHERKMVVDSYDAFLRSEAICRALEPDVILRFGSVPTSAALVNFFTQHARSRQILVDDGGWPDPTRAACEMLCADPLAVAEDLAGVGGWEGDRKWVDRWRLASRVTRETIARALDSMEEWFEGKIFSELALLLPEKAALFAGNSMPVRDLDGFFPSLAKQIRFAGNRGASGIDGVLSTALGFSAAVSEPLVLVVGDLSFYHDLNGLYAVRKNGLSATIVLINNDGGGIFSFLPQAKHPEHFEALFGTPHGLDFMPAASLYGLEIRRVSSWNEFRGAIRDSVGESGTRIVEVRSERERNAELHRQIWSSVIGAVEPLAKEWL